MKPVLLVLVVVVVAPACDLFGQIRCDKDADCPDNLQFCNSGACAKSADDGRPGRGLGEGEGEGEGAAGACATDTDCGSGLCYDVDDSTGAKDKCVPLATDDASCAEVAGLGGADRGSGGAVIFSGVVTRGSTDCTGGTPGGTSLQIQVRYLDRESDLDISNTQGFVFVPGGSSPTPTGPGSIAGDGQSGDAFLFDNECVGASVDHIAYKLGRTSPESSALCLTVPP